MDDKQTSEVIGRDELGGFQIFHNAHGFLGGRGVGRGEGGQMNTEQILVKISCFILIDWSKHGVLHHLVMGRGKDTFWNEMKVTGT